MTTNDVSDVLAALQRLETLLSNHDLAILQEFSASPDLSMVGSELKEVARGHHEVGLLVRAIYDHPVHFEWQWRSRAVSMAGEVAWVFAEGEIVYRGAGPDQRAPYRLTVVMAREEGRWRCRHFHGSEPAQHS